MSVTKTNQRPTQSSPRLPRSRPPVTLRTGCHDPVGQGTEFPVAAKGHLAAGPCSGNTRNSGRTRSTHRSPTAISRVRAFTLAELLVSLTLMALLTIAIVGSTRALSTTRTRVDERIAASAAARQGIEAIVAALRNVRRDPDSEHRLILGEPGDGGNSRIDLQVIGDIKARSDSPESDQYEVGFTVYQREDGVPVLLCRRNNALADKPGKGGIATVVAEGIVGLSFEYYSQGQWQSDWTEAEIGIPEAIRVTVAATGARKPTAKVTPVTLSTIVPIHAETPEDISPTQGDQSGQEGKTNNQGKSSPSGGASNQRGGTR